MPGSFYHIFPEKKKPCGKEPVLRLQDSRSRAANLIRMAFSLTSIIPGGTCMNHTVIVFDSMNGNTEYAAERISL